MIGLRRQVRASVATVLAGTASVLQMAAGLAETVAQELRLTLDGRDGEAPQGGAAPPSGRRAAPAPSAGRSLSDVTGRAEPRRLTAVDGVGRPPFPEEPPVVPGGGTDLGAGEGEAVPPPRSGRGATGNGRAAAAGGGTVGTTRTTDEPPPWIDDVAASVAGGTVREATARLPELTPTQLRAVERHERSHAGRVTLLRAIDAELALRGD